MNDNPYTINMSNSTTIDLSTSLTDCDSNDAITISADDSYNNIMWSTSAVGAVGASGSVFTTNGTGGYNWVNNNPMTVKNSGTLELRGEDADININGESLMSTLKEIRDHLRIPDRLNRNAELESEFEELRALGEQYREMEAKYKSHKKVFDILKRED